MADFVGLLKKTIEAQSQMTPQLRQRIYERARATVERKLAESQAPAPIIERQFEVLNRAIDEVEAYYQAQDASYADLSENADLSPQNMTDVVDSAVSPDEESGNGKEEQDAEVESPEVRQEQSSLMPEQVMVSSPSEPLILSPIEAPPPFEEAFEREGEQKQLRRDDVPTDEFPQQISGHDLPTQEEPPVQERIVEAQAGDLSEAARHTIPSLASLLNADRVAPTQDPAPLSDDLPFLVDEADAPSDEMPDHEAASPLADELLAQLPVNDPASLDVPEELTPLSSTAQDAPSRASALNDYLPHWSEDEGQMERTEDVRPQDGSSIPGDLLPFSPLDQAMDSPSVNLAQPTKVESEIDQARRDIEALRTNEMIVDEPPFLADLPVDPISTLDPSMTPPQPTITGSEADFDNDRVSEIFVQAAKREQKQSSKKRRIAAFVIATIVLAVLAAIVGVLIITNEYPIGNGLDPVAQTQDQIPSSLNGSEPTNDLTIDSSASDSQLPKITRRLLPDGQESDPGPAIEEPRPGEGSSQATPTVPVIDNSARAVFYEAPTDLLSETANEGRVDWSLRRTAASASVTDGQSDQADAQELALVGDVKIPALDMTLRLTLRRNHDETVPADYLTEIIFVLPDDFEGEVIDEVGPLLFKASEQSTGQELAGTVTAKVRDNLFLMAVRAPGPILDRNLALMRQLPWLKLNVLYKNGRVGEFSIAKGEGGNRLFQQAIDEWSRQANRGQSNMQGAVTTPSLQPPEQESSQDEADSPSDDGFIADEAGIVDADALPIEEMNEGPSSPLRE